jgi:hypothetical protein
MLTLNTLAPSLIRTWVPVIVGSFLSWLITVGIELDERSSTALITALTGLLIAAYYTAVRLLERRWPQVGVLLGLAKTPDSYSNDQTIPGAVVEESALPEYPTADVEPVDDDVPGRHEAAPSA